MQGMREAQVAWAWNGGGDSGVDIDWARGKWCGHGMRGAPVAWAWNGGGTSGVDMEWGRSKWRAL